MGSSTLGSIRLSRLCSRQVRVSCSFWQGQGQVLKKFSGCQELLRLRKEGSGHQNSSSPDSWSGLPLYRRTGTHV